MTETDWLACEDPTPMWVFLRGPESLLTDVVNGRSVEFTEYVGPLTSKRKLRLVATACCQRIEHLLTETNRRVLDSSELLADGVIDVEQFATCMTQASDAFFASLSSTFAYGVTRSAAECVLLLGDWLSLGRLLDQVGRTVCEELSPRYLVAEHVAQSGLFREIVGNPFRSATLAPAWRTSTAVALAAQMYESREFGAMPILADALQDAGCDSDDILVHCRGPGPHVRGCWVVDFVLGKE